MLLPLELPAIAAELEEACDSIERLLDELIDAPADIDVPGLLKQVDWQWGQRKSLFDGIAAALALSPEQRSLLLSCFQADRRFAAAYDDDAFRFAFRTLDEPTAAAGKLLLNDMYEMCVDRSLFGRTFREANPDVRVCPYCLLSDLTAPIDGRKLLHADHVLPRAHYPHLSAHPDNLVLVCTTCNGFKLAKDPLVNGHAVLALPQMYLPYVRAALDELEITFTVSTASSRIIKLTGTGPGVHDRLAMLDRILAISHRWSHHVETYHETLLCRLNGRYGPNTDRAAVLAYLEDQALDADLSRGADPVQLLDRDWLTWLATDGLDALLEELRQRERERSGRTAGGLRRATN
jgi:5-methylcytosine-specific restriction endonuclease McrA